MRRASAYVLARGQSEIAALSSIEDEANDSMNRRYSLPASSRHDPAMKIVEMKAQTLKGILVVVKVS